MKNRIKTLFLFTRILVLFSSIITPVVLYGDWEDSWLYEKIQADMGEIKTVPTTALVSFSSIATLTRKKHPYRMKTVVGFDVDKVFYESIDKDQQENMTSFKITDIIITVEVDDDTVPHSKQLPDNLYLSFEYMADVSDPEIPLMQAEVFTRYSLSKGLYGRGYFNENLDSLSDILYSDMKTVDSTFINSNGDTVNVEAKDRRVLNRAFFVIEFLSKEFRELEHVDVKMEIKTELETIVKF